MSHSPPVAVSVVLPVYNAAGQLPVAVEQTLQTLSDTDVEVIIAEDGCTDATPEVAASLAAADDRVVHLHSEQRLGRGAALDRAFTTARGRTLAYLDVDLATDMRHLPALIAAVADGPADIAVGSRYAPGAEVARPPRRAVPSRVYNWLVRRGTGSQLADHQCGFKAIDATVYEQLRGSITDRHWFFDTELVVQAQRAGLRVTELPVRWEPQGETTVELGRDVVGMGTQLLRLTAAVRVGPQLRRWGGVAGGVALTLAAIALMTQYIAIDAVLQAVRSISTPVVATAAVVYVLSWPVRGVRYRAIVAAMRAQVQLPAAIAAIFISQLGNLVVPARAGDLLRAYVLRRVADLPYPVGVASLAAERIFDLLSLGVLAGLVVLGFAVTGDAPVLGGVVGGASGAGAVAVGVAMVVLAVVVSVVVAIVVSGRLQRRVRRRALRWAAADLYRRRIADVVLGVLVDLQRVTTRPRRVAVVGGASLVVWLIDVVVAVLVLGAFGVPVGAGWLVVVGTLAVSVGNLAKVLPLSPGGIGLYEGAFTLLVVGLTPIPAATALAAAIVDHALKNVITIVGGAGAFGALNLSVRRTFAESRELADDGLAE
jgi:uncharacterized protein (TIRG00374 family)